MSEEASRTSGPLFVELYVKLHGDCRVISLSHFTVTYVLFPSCIVDSAKEMRVVDQLDIVRVSYFNLRAAR